MQFLDLLWTSGIIQTEGHISYSEERIKFVEKVERGEEELKVALNREQYAVFDKYIRNYEELHNICQRDEFISGFRLGVKCMIDVFAPRKEREG